MAKTGSSSGAILPCSVSIASPKSEVAPASKKFHRDKNRSLHAGVVRFPVDYGGWVTHSGQSANATGSVSVTLPCPKFWLASQCRGEAERTGGFAMDHSDNLRGPCSECVELPAFPRAE